MKCLINAQSFIDDAGSIKRKRKKLNNDPSSIILKAETENHAGNQLLNTFTVKTEPPSRISPFDLPTTEVFRLQSVGSSSQPYSNIKTVRPPQASPGQVSSLEYSIYNPSLVQQQYQPNIQPTNMSTTMDMQPFFYINQLQQEQNLLPLNTLNNQGETQPANNISTAGAQCLLDMDNQQFNFDYSELVDLTDFANLSENLSIGLSISDSLQHEVGNNAEERNSITEHINSINQELCALNKILKPNRENNG